MCLCFINSIYQPTNAHIISHRTLLKHSELFRSCQIIIRELFSLQNLCYSIHNSLRICKCCNDQKQTSLEAKQPEFSFVIYFLQLLYTLIYSVVHYMINYHRATFTFFFPFMSVSYTLRSGPVVTSTKHHFRYRFGVLRSTKHTQPLLHNTLLHNMICCHNTSFANTN